MPNKRIEDVINDLLKGDAQKNALDFVAHLRASEIPLEESENYWEVKYQDESVCFLFITGADDAPGPWTVWSDQAPGTWAAWPDGEHSGEYVDFPIDGRIWEIAWANVNPCGGCGGDCSPGMRKIVLGKAFDNLCKSTMAFTDPDAEALDCAKKMIDIRIGDILRNR
jgi:hypothetical protein